jgi:serine protease
LSSNFSRTTLFQRRRSLLRPSPPRPPTELPTSRRRLALAATAALAAATLHAGIARAAAGAGAGAHVSAVPGEVVVTYGRHATGAERRQARRAAGVGGGHAVTGRTDLLEIRDGQSVDTTVRQLRAQPGVKHAAPNAIAHAAVWIPRDPGRSGRPAGWQATQWNFDGLFGVNAPDAWNNLILAGHPGGKGVTVAVLDTGVAYENHGRYRRSPDFRKSHFVRPYDFVGHDHHPDDENGHGTHVAGTINEATGNKIGVTGLAYGARIMPVRVLDRIGEGDSVTISQGIRYAVKHGADVINLSFEFDPSTSRRDVPDLLAALRYANRHRVLVVAASGNSGRDSLAYPARAPSVLSVGATTEHGCEADYSNSGTHLDLVAPGGGPDADVPGDPRCRPEGPDGEDIFQMTFRGSVRSFGLPRGYVGTSMAAPHATATAALVIASGVIGHHPTPAAIERRLRETARPLGPAEHYGAGLLDAAAATAPAP